MKCVKFLLIVVFVLTAAFAFSQTTLVYETFGSKSLARWTPASGNWKVMEGRLVQTNANEKMAMITIPVNQSGDILYEFDVKYVSGGQDDYAGFGIHVCVNKPSKSRTWGNGRSLLGWVTWDPKHYGYPGGFIHLYDSKGATSMGLSTRVFPGSDIMRYGDRLPIARQYLQRKYLGYTIPVKIRLDTKTGRGRIYDPFDPDRYFYRFSLGGAIRPGDFFTFRTNSVSVSIDNLKISKLD
ncbi:MAG: hypothetical protein JSV25_13945 [Spirochaetota bacterium]|nr:MAG: hypothetical protein JSV25_13945 [Spirochaetota bacterium]